MVSLSKSPVSGRQCGLTHTTAVLANWTPKVAGLGVRERWLVFRPLEQRAGVLNVPRQSAAGEINLATELQGTMGNGWQLPVSKAKRLSFPDKVRLVKIKF